ncbi:hypothetical protein O181_028782 [Austropuccinia psidii MF-1]|uniref:Uncharacterized protein n=1 Tax=Austropuccinia psidii MF-1 TaxID=1389203 RepID=A0A9Q3CSL3_9BASI|nr:hypothetical protein [Austropuccinia psidii MF-1]
MPAQQSPSSRQTRSQTNSQALLTPNPRDPLDGTPVEGRGPGRSSSFSRAVGTVPCISRTNCKGPAEDGKDEEDNSLEEKGSDGIDVAPAPVGTPQGTGGPTLSQFNQPVSQKSQPFSWEFCSR